mmetsp:Transcript_7860/g.13655  ORF Transcript_7860/g.13655 Transcript_7860/m.13655 type:complete len:196 (-) Transcript_7860:121-708(-)
MKTSQCTSWHATRKSNGRWLCNLLAQVTLQGNHGASQTRTGTIVWNGLHRLQEQHEELQLQKTMRIGTAESMRRSHLAFFVLLLIAPGESCGAPPNSAWRWPPRVHDPVEAFEPFLPGTILIGHSAPQCIIQKSFRNASEEQGSCTWNELWKGSSAHCIISDTMRSKHASATFREAEPLQHAPVSWHTGTTASSN